MKDLLRILSPAVAKHLANIGYLQMLYFHLLLKVHELNDERVVYRLLCAVFLLDITSSRRRGTDFHNYNQLSGDTVFYTDTSRAAND